MRRPSPMLHAKLALVVALAFACAAHTPSLAFAAASQSDSGAGTTTQEAGVSARSISGIKGGGTEQSPYLIYTADDLRLLAQDLNGRDTAGVFVSLEADVDLNPHITFNEDGTASATPIAWTPIGSEGNPFKGVFLGNGHTVAGVYIDSGNGRQGFFGDLSGATVRGLIVGAGYIRGNGRVGGITGSASNSQIISCENYAYIHSTGSYAGGIVGFAQEGSHISQCANNGKLVGGTYQNGGIVGRSESSTVDRCANYADVDVSDHAGGIAGYNVNGTISNCLNEGDVSTTNSFYTYTAGIVANNVGTQSLVENCLNRGAIAGQQGTGCQQVGLVAGHDEGGTAAKNSYSVGDIALGYADDDSATVTNEQMSSEDLLDKLNGGSASSIWGFSPDGTVAPIGAGGLAPQAAPTGVTVGDELTAGGNDGSLSNLPAGSEWRAAGGTWTPSPESGTVGELAPGAYEVRMAAGGNYAASDSVTLTIKSFSETHGGISYPDGTTDDGSGSAVLPDGGGAITWPDGETATLPGGTVVDPASGVATTPGGETVAPDGSGSLAVTTPDGGNLTVPSGSAIAADGTVTGSDGAPLWPLPAQPNEGKPGADKGALPATGDPGTTLALLAGVAGAATLAAARMRSRQR